MRGPAAAAAQLNAMPVNDRLGILGSGVQYLSAYKTVDQGVNNSVVLVNDAELSLHLPYTPIGAGIQFRALLNLQIAAAANNINLQLFADEGLVLDATQTRYYAEFKLSNTSPILITALTNTSLGISGGVTNAWTQLSIEGGFRVLQPGLLRLQFAQNVAAGNTTSILRGSSVFAFYIAPGL